MSAVTGFKRLGLAVGVLILGVFGALAVVSVLLPTDQVREAVKAEIRAATGLDPILRGDVSVSLFPYGQVVLSDVSLGDSQGEPPLAAARLTARLSFLPLLAGRIDIADLTLSDPRIVVTVDSDGRSNWSPLLDIADARLQSRPPQRQLAILLGNPHHWRHHRGARRLPQYLRIFLRRRPVAGLARDFARASPSPAMSAIAAR